MEPLASQLQEVIPFLSDKTPEVRYQAAQILTQCVSLSPESIVKLDLIRHFQRRIGDHQVTPTETVALCEH